MSNYEGVMPEFCFAWARQDLHGALKYVHDDIVYSMFIPQDVVPFGGETRGKAAMADRMRTILEQFAMERFEIIAFKRQSDVEHTRVDYAFCHRSTQETISGVMRLVSVVKNGLIIDLKEFHDLEKVKAFMRLIAHKANDQ